MFIIAILLILISSAFSAPIVECDIGVPGYPHAPVVGDIDTNGYPEIVVGYGASSRAGDLGGLIIFRKYADNTADTIFNWSIGTGDVFTPYIGDVDGDNLPEICVQFRRPGADDSIIVFNHDFTVLWRAVVGSGSGSMTVEGGHAITAGDIEGDGRIEVFASETRSNYIRVFDGRTGRFIRDIREAGNFHPYGALTLWNLDESGPLEILSSFYQGGSWKVCAFHTNDGTSYWRVENSFAYGVADMNNDGQPEVVLERNYGGRTHIELYRFNGTRIGEITSFQGHVFFPHFGLPVIAEFDTSTPDTPEVVFAINHITLAPGSTNYQVTACYRSDGREIWRFLMRNGEFVSVTAADLNCDLIPEVAALSFNDDTAVVIIDGATGSLWGLFAGPVPIGTQDNEMVAIADVDLDFHTEFIYNGQYSYSGPYVIRIIGNDDRWNPTRPIWNEGGFYYTSIEDNLGLLHRSYTNWRDENIFRCQKIVPCGLGVVLHDSIECAGCGEFTNLRLHVDVINTYTLVPAPSSWVRIEILEGNDCLTPITPSDRFFLGNIEPRGSTHVYWEYLVSNTCPRRYLVVRFYAWSSDTANFDSVYYDFKIKLPVCTDFADVENIRPLPCGGIMTCADSIQQMLAFFVESHYYPIDFASMELVVNDTVHTIDEFNLLKQGDNNIIYVPVPPFKNGDTVRFQLRQVITQTVQCTSWAEPCSVIIDLQPPILYDPFPSEGARIYFTPTEFRVHIIDSIAGVNWSTVDTAIAHVTSIVDTADIPVVRSGDTLLIVPLTSFTQAGTVTVCFSGIEDAPTILYCPPNVADTCFHYVVLSRFVALPLYPDSAKYNACQDGILKMLFAYHQFPIDLSTVRLRIMQDEDTVVIPGSDPRMSIVGEDTLVFAPDSGFWRDGVKVTVCLDDARDIYGGELSNSPVCWWFWNDFSPPVAWMESPAEDDTTFNLLQEIVIGLYDSMAGVDTSKLVFWLNSDTFPDHSKLSWTYHSKRDTIYFIFAPRAFDYRYAQGDTIYVNVSICDTPDYCGPNCGDYLFRFFIGELHSCERFPNPFTPNADGVNDYVQFYYPDFFLEAGEILIFDSHERLVKRISVPTGGAAKVAARWDGTDEDGNPLPPGLYVYIITVRGELVCEGTITLAR